MFKFRPSLWRYKVRWNPQEGVAAKHLSRFSLLLSLTLAPMLCFAPQNTWCENSGLCIKALLALFIYPFLWLQWVFFSAYELFIVARRIQFSGQRLNLGPLHWECRVLTTRPPGKCQSSSDFMKLSIFLISSCSKFRFPKISSISFTLSSDFS